MRTLCLWFWGVATPLLLTACVQTPPTAGEVTIKFTQEQFVRGLEREGLQLELASQTFIGTRTIQRDVIRQRSNLVHRKLRDRDAAYAEAAARLRSSLTLFAELRGAVQADQFEPAADALARGRTKPAERVVRQFSATSSKAFGQTAEVAYRLGRFAESLVDYEAADSSYRLAASGRPDNPGFAVAAGNMAKKLARYDDAETHYFRALGILRDRHGPEHAAFATVLNELSGSYKKQGRFRVAEKGYLLALRIRKKVLEPTHPDLVRTLVDLGTLHEKRKHYIEAEPRYLEALSILEKSRDPSSLEIVDIMTKLADLYRRQDRHDEAEPVYLQLAAFAENAFGRGDPQVAAALNGVADIQNETERYAEAEAGYLRALQIYEQSFGPSHPSVAYTLNRLAGAIDRLGRHNEARSHYRRALAIQEESLGLDHSDTAVTKFNLARHYLQQGQPEKALPLAEDAHTTFIYTHGSKHDQTNRTKRLLLLIRHATRG